MPSSATVASDSSPLSPGPCSSASSPQAPSQSSSSSTASMPSSSSVPGLSGIQPSSSLPDMHDAATVTRLLKQDGFSRVFEWTDRPSAFYAAHSHAACNAHYVLRGDMTVRYPQLGRTVRYVAGDRFDVPAGVVHTASVGPQGCDYVVGER